MSELPAPAAPAEPHTTFTPGRLDPSQYALRLFASCGNRPPDRGLWRTLVDYVIGTVKEFTVQSPPRQTKSGQIITCKPRTVPARYVVLAAYHVYFLSDGGGSAGTDRDRWSIPKMAAGCRLSVRYMSDALTVCHALRIVKRVRDSQRKGYRYLMNAGGMTFAALRTRVQQTASTSTLDVLSPSTLDGLKGYVRTHTTTTREGRSATQAVMWPEPTARQLEYAADLGIDTAGVDGVELGERIERAEAERDADRSERRAARRSERRSDRPPRTAVEARRLAEAAARPSPGRVRNCPACRTLDRGADCHCESCGWREPGCPHTMPA